MFPQNEAVKIKIHLQNIRFISFLFVFLFLMGIPLLFQYICSSKFNVF